MPSASLVKRAARLAYMHGMAIEREAIALAVPDGLELSDEEHEDVLLINAILEAEHELRRRQWAALEALLPLIPPGGDESEVVYLPRPLALRAVLLARACGWFW